MLYFATFDFHTVRINGIEAVSVLVTGQSMIAFGSSYEMVKGLGDAYARQHDLMVVDNVCHMAYSPVTR